MRARNKGARLWIAAAVIVAVAAGGGAYALLLRKGRSAAAAPQTTRLYSVQKVEQTELVSVDGNLKPVEARDLAFPTGGTLVELAVAEGDRVAKGQLIARLEDSGARYDVAVVEQSIEEQRLAGAARRIALLELEREVKRTALRNTRLEAPFAGFVSAADVEVGQTVAASTTIARVIDRTTLIAEVEVDELDAPRVRPGQEVRFHLEALPTLDLRGIVASVPVEGRVTSDGVAVVDATVRLENPPREVLPGYSFSAEIVVSAKREVLVADKKALLERDGRFVAFKASGPGRPPERVQVEAKDLGDGRYEIVKGLAEGDSLVAPPTASSANGSGAATNTPANPLGLFGIPQPGGSPAGRLRQGAPR